MSVAQLELVHPAPLPLQQQVSEPRPEHAVIARLVNIGARVLDVGCGDGALMQLLERERDARVHGVELDPAKAQYCVTRRLSVVQADADHDLEHFPSGSVDYVVFSHTLLSLRDPQQALKTAARVGDRVIVAFKNAGHWRTRLRFAREGRLANWRPEAMCSVRDFAEMARSLRLSIERAVPVSGQHAGAPFAKTLWRPNWFAEQAVFLLTP